MAKKGITYVGLLLDETGSMGAILEQTINGFNEYLQTLQDSKEADHMRFTLVKFNDKIEVVHDDVPVSEAEKISVKTYVPEHFTPLYDAIGTMVRRMDDKPKKKDKVLFIIQTDGQENASREMDLDTVRGLIEQRQRKNWTFVFLGADIDAYAIGRSLSVPVGNTMAYASADTKGVLENMGRRTATYSASRGQSSSVSFFKETEDEEEDE